MSAAQTDMDEATWAERYQPHDDQVDLATARTHDPHHVWTVLDADGSLVAAAGEHYVNRTGDYIITLQPWATGDETVVLFCGCLDPDCSHFDM